MARRLHFTFIGMVFFIGPLLVLFLIAQTYASFHDVLRDNNKRPTHLETVPNTESGEIKKLSQALYNIYKGKRGQKNVHNVDRIVDLVTKKTVRTHNLDTWNGGVQKPATFSAAYDQSLVVEGPYPRVLNLKPMTMSRYLVFDILREPDGYCYEKVPECAVQAQRGLDQANEEYRQQDAIIHFKEKQNAVEAREIETLRETQAKVEKLDIGDGGSNSEKESFNPRAFLKPSFLQIKALAIPTHEEMERHIVIKKQLNITRKGKQTKTQQSVTKTQRNVTKTQQSVTKTQRNVTKTQRNETRKEENAEGRDDPGEDKDENAAIATKVDPKVEMEKRKAVKKELEEMRKVDPPDERNDDIADAIKDLHWRAPYQAK